MSIVTIEQQREDRVGGREEFGNAQGRLVAGLSRGHARVA